LGGGYSIEGMARSIGVPQDDVSNRLELLAEAGYGSRRGSHPVPTFSTALREGVVRVKELAVYLGRELAEHYEFSRDLAVETYRKLSVSHGFRFDRAALVLGGARSLNV
jgi:hypothetical protein